MTETTMSMALTLHDTLLAFGGIAEVVSFMSNLLMTSLQSLRYK